MSITLTIVKFDEIADILATAETHWKEAGQSHILPFNVDLEKYRAIDQAGKLSIAVARTDTGDLVGYSVDILGRHPHCDATTGLNSALYVKPEYRRDGIPKELVIFVQEYLRTLGVKFHIISMTPQKKFYSLLEKSGYSELETNFYKEL